MRDQAVLLILEPAWDGDLWRASRAQHVWIPETPAHAARIADVRRRDGGGHRQGRGITAFAWDEPRASLVEALAAIDEHHAGSDAERLGPWIEIAVVGLAWDDALEPLVDEALPDVAWEPVPAEGGFRLLRR